MIIITGERFQDLCKTQISKIEHKPFESNINSIDIDTFDFTDFDNDELVYCNSSLLNAGKPKLIESKLNINPFRTKNLHQRLKSIDSKKPKDCDCFFSGFIFMVI